MNARQQHIEALARELARKLKAELPPDVGFIVLTASHGEGGYTGFMSTIDRQSACALMREFLEKMEAS